MDANEVLKKAWAAVEGSGVPESLYETAFSAAVSLLTSRVSSSPPFPPATDPAAIAAEQTTSPATNAPTRSSTPGDFFERVARVSDFSASDLREIFWLEDDAVHLVPKARDLGDNSSDQMRSVALLLTAAYSWGFSANDTSLEVIAAECRDLHCLDTKNFTTRVSNYAPLIVAGASRKKVAKTKPSTQTAFDKVVSDVIGRQAPEA